MDYKVPASYCVQCGDLKRLCRCKTTIEQKKEKDFSEITQKENGKVENTDHPTVSSDKFETTKEENETKTSQENQRSVSKTREVFKQLENANHISLSPRPGSGTSDSLSEETNISENISRSVYETFGVRLRSKKSSSGEAVSQTPTKDTSPVSAEKCLEETESHSVPNSQESKSTEEKTRHVSDAIASKLVLFDHPERPEDSKTPQKLSSSSIKGTVCVVCRRPVHPVEKFLSPKGEMYHTNCLRCAVCQCLLDSSCMNVDDNNFLCNKCFVKKPRSKMTSRPMK
ncbi:hypothetical protein GAYE_SCF04G2432 [Galdieria yellowstonensis]|uniref:LIM zinc-binding domain-containing protein n=1 Tax=Galdieria yellowstonensis TaxID=3028027 RepID=A0AAV9IBG8_9RHOD|nr:hypothetical protein GAYE_SCF04G2432 [Galdieria yellowstonensis]